MAEGENNPNLKVVVLRKAEREEPADPAAPTHAHAAPADESTVVPLKPPGSPLQALAEAVAASSEIDSARVEATRQALAQGTYVVDSEEIARKLTALERELPAPPPVQPED